VTVIVEYFEGLLNKKDAEINNLKSRCDIMNKRICKLEEEVDASSARNARDTLILSGDIPAATTDENCKKIVCDVLRDKISSNLQPSDIQYARRIGAATGDANLDKRSLLFKLSNPSGKYEVFRACKEHKPPI